MVNPATLFKMFTGKDEQHQEFCRAAKYREGKLGDVMLNSWYKDVAKKYNLEYGLDICDAIVQAVTDELTIDGFDLSAPEGTPQTKLERARQLIDNAWQYNRGDVDLAPVAHDKTGELGEGAVLVWDDGPDDDTPTMAFIDAKHGRFTWDPFRRFTPVAFTYWGKLDEKDEDGNDLVWLNHLTDDAMYKYMCPIEQVEDADSWQPRYEDGPRMVTILDAQGNDVEVVDIDANGLPVPLWPLPNPYGRVTAEHLRTGTGPEHRKAYKQANLIDSSVNTMSLALEYGGLGMLFFVQDPDMREKMLEFGSGASPMAAALPTGPSRSAQLEEGPINQSFQKGANLAQEVWAKSVEKISSDGIEHFAQAIDMQVEHAAVATRTAISDLKVVPGGSPSAASRLVERAKFRNKLAARRRNYGSTWSDVLELMLSMIDDSLSDIRVSVRWSVTQELTPGEQMDVAVQQVELFRAVAPLPKGLRRQVLMSAGFKVTEMDGMDADLDELAATMAKESQRETTTTRLPQVA